MKGKQNQLNISSELETIGLLKFELLATGMKISTAAKHPLKEAKGSIRTRSGASGGLDVILPYDVYANVPINEKFASQSQ